MARTQFGARITGCSGTEIVQCPQRSTADRIRRACRAHAAAGGWTGAHTLRALADLAADRPGRTASAIVAEFSCAREA